MRKLRNFSTLLLAAAMILGFAGCQDNPNDGGGEEEGSVVDFTNHLSGFSVKVQNNTNKKLVVFKNSPNASYLIGGIPGSGSNEHGLPKPSGLFTATGDFVLFIVTEEDYIENKDNLSVLANRPFTRVYAYYNANAENYIVYPISSVLGGTSKITLNNNTGFNVELRTDGVHGPVLGYAAQGSYNTTFNVDQGDYMVFPVFRKYNAARGEIITVYPKYTSGLGAGKAKFTTFSLNANRTEEIIDASDFIGSNLELKTGSAYLVITNNHNTGLEFLNGGQPILTSTGSRFINRGETLTFQVDMPKKPGSNDEYLDSLTLTNFRLGTPAHKVGLDSHTFESDKIYQVYVTGADPFDVNFSAITEIGTISWDSL